MYNFLIYHMMILALSFLITLYYGFVVLGNSDWWHIGLFLSGRSKANIWDEASDVFFHHVSSPASVTSALLSVGTTMVLGKLKMLCNSSQYNSYIPRNF